MGSEMCIRDSVLSYHASLPSGPAIILSAGAVYALSILFGTRGVLIDLLGSGRHRAA